MWSSYVFETRQIQEFVFLTNKLRDATGASELINSIAGVDQSVEGEVIYTGIAANILARLKVDHIVHRATGGVIDISCLIQDDLYRFRAALRLTLAQEIPGLIYSDGVGTGPDQSASRSAARIDAASSLINTDLFPVGGPLFRPAPRSGGIPAVRKGLTSGEVCKATKEFADLPTLVKRGRAK